MIYKIIDQVTSGDINGRNIYGSNKIILVSKGMLFTVAIIAKLKKLGVSGVFVKDSRFGNNEIEESVSEETKFETLASLYDLVGEIGHVKVDLDPIRKNVENLIKEIEKNKEMLISLTNIRTQDNHLFIHALHVCIIAISVAGKLNIDKEGLKTIAMTAVLHELVKTNQAKEHLKELNPNSARVFHIFKLMREKIKAFEKEGIEPQEYKMYSDNKKLQLYAEIVAIADCYDSLSSQFSTSPTLPPHEAVEWMMVLAGKIYDLEVMNAFLRSVSIYPNGYPVKLNTGETGIIVRQNTALPMRPIVGIMKGDFHRDDVVTFEVKEWDLANETTIFITDIVTFQEEMKKDENKAGT